MDRRSGFTLIEILVVIGIIAILCALSFINLGRPQTTTSLIGTVETLQADIKGQQLLAMVGDGGSTSNQQPQGLKIETDQYTLFAGSEFDGDDSNNFTNNPGHGISFSTDFPDSQILFDKTSGEIDSYSPGDNTITVQKDGDSRTLILNRFGRIVVQ